MDEREVAKIILSQNGLTFNKNIIRQNIFQNYLNGSDLFRRNKLNLPKTPHKLVDGYPTLRRFSNAYTDSLMKLNPNKSNLKYNTNASFDPLKNAPTVNVSRLSYLALSLNNPYFYTLQENRHNQNNDVNMHAAGISNDGIENVKFLTLLNDLKSLYTGASFSEKTNESRNHKLNILIDYFSNYNNENDLKLDDKGCLVYKNLSTNTKFALYVDYFVKYPNETRSKSLPLYFRELFLDKISNSQSKFNPTIHYKPFKPEKSPKKKRSNEDPDFSKHNKKSKKRY